jgi:hypothetical protein
MYPPDIDDVPMELDDVSERDRILAEPTPTLPPCPMRDMLVKRSEEQQRQKMNDAGLCCCYCFCCILYIVFHFIDKNKSTATTTQRNVIDKMVEKLDERAIMKLHLNGWPPVVPNNEQQQQQQQRHNSITIQSSQHSIEMFQQLRQIQKSNGVFGSGVSFAYFVF